MAILPKQQADWQALVDYLSPRGNGACLNSLLEDGPDNTTDFADLLRWFQERDTLWAQFDESDCRLYINGELQIQEALARIEYWNEHPGLQAQSKIRLLVRLLRERSWYEVS